MHVVAALFSLLPLLAVVNGAYTPRSRHIHARHAAILHARSPAPAPAPVPVPVSVHPLKKRDSKKCRARPSSSSIAPAPSHSVAPANPAAAPSPTTSDKQVTTSHRPQPTPSQEPHTSTHKDTPPPSPTTHRQQPAPTHTQSSGGNGGGSSGGGDTSSNPADIHSSSTFTGQLTYYDLGLTACGQTYSDNDYVAAVSQLLFDTVEGAGANPNNNPVCNKKMSIEFEGKSVTVTVVDRCTACAKSDVDLSPAAFRQLADQSRGRVSGAKWHWLN